MKSSTPKWRRQRQTCADRFPNDDDATMFLVQLEEADKLHRRATQLRIDAWRMYREKANHEFA